MSGIICAIRGGEGSRPTIKKGIEESLAGGTTLNFLFVVDVDFMKFSSSSRLDTLWEELDNMGEFILLAAQQKAIEQGVRAEAYVRHGKIMEEIIKLSAEIEADSVILGMPQPVEGEVSTFDLENLKTFAAAIEEKTNAKVLFAGDEL